MYGLTIDSERGLTNLDLIEYGKNLKLDISEVYLCEMLFQRNLGIKNVEL